VWPQLLCQQHLFTRYRHLIVDNVEEDTPLAHEVVRAWLGQCDSALVICDWDAGYRIFLGADPEGGKRLAEACKGKVRWTGSRVASEDMLRLGQELGRSLGGSSEMTEGDMWEGRYVGSLGFQGGARQVLSPNARLGRGGGQTVGG